MNVFALPHNGSHRNYSLELPGALPKAVHFVAPAGPNSYGHPAEEVKRAVRADERTIVRVSEKPKSALEWRHRI